MNNGLFSFGKSTIGSLISSTEMDPFFQSKNNGLFSFSNSTIGSLTPGTLYRAALEGVALNLAAGLDRMRALGLAPSVIRIVGGASKNPLWPSILAGAFDCPVEPLAETETAALGGAIQIAAAARGVHVSEVQIAGTAGDPIQPEERERPTYADLRARFASAVEQVGGH